MATELELLAEIKEAAAASDAARHAELVDEDRHPETGEALDGSEEEG